MFDMTETDSTFSTLTYFAGPSSVYAYDLSYQVYIVDQHGELHPCSHGYLDHDYRDDRLVFTLGDVLYSFDQLGVLCRRGSTGRWRPMAVYHRLEDVPQAHVNIGLAPSYQPNPVTCEETPVAFTTPIVSPSSVIEDTIDPSQLLRQMSTHTDISPDSPLTSPEPESDLDSLSADDSSPDLLKDTLNTRLLFTPPDARPTEAARAFWKSLRSDGSAMTKRRIDEFVDAVVSENRGSRKRTRSYSCIMCSAIQRRPSAYKIHLYSHFKFKVAQCKDCLQWFSTPSNRDRHHCKFKTTSYTWCSDA